ncbi:hypothetical protein ACRAWF_32065 [Streptomyces sp. L7]
MLGGADRDEVLGRNLGGKVTVACHRMDVVGDPRASTPDDLGRVEFRDGDRVTTLRVVDPHADEVSYTRRWGAGTRDLDGATDEVATDAEVRGRGGAEYVVRHHARPEREVVVREPRRVVVTGLGAVTPLGVGGRRAAGGAARRSARDPGTGRRGVRGAARTGGAWDRAPSTRRELLPRGRRRGG